MACCAQRSPLWRRATRGPFRSSRPSTRCRRRLKFTAQGDIRRASSAFEENRWIPLETSALPTATSTERWSEVAVLLAAASRRASVAIASALLRGVVPCDPAVRHASRDARHGAYLCDCRGSRQVSMISPHFTPTRSPTRYTRSGVEDCAQVSVRLASYLSGQAQRGWTKWHVEDGTGKMIGCAGFGVTEDARRRQFGYMFAPGVWGAGLASELATALVAWHRAHPDPALEPELVAHAFVDNVASHRVLEKVGFPHRWTRERPPRSPRSREVATSYPSGPSKGVGVGPFTREPLVSE